ncbi:MAG: toll/interleukin-1 receptor domain-containing protein [Clostridiales Family XIII bacterium]|jgi:hypothetical protein|nr:toll/interleukin-1 receptor domain-containing protein [Clostridiales Family XIII bacterium]
MQSVFISHNNSDKPIAREIALFLVAEGINVWFDEWAVEQGDSITEKVSEGLKNCTHLLLLWSENAKESNWVKRELNASIPRIVEDQNIKLIPVLLDEMELPSLLADIRYIRYSEGTEQDRNDIIEAVTGNSSSRTFIEAVVKKYHEVIFDDNSSEPFPLKACPKCGSSRLNFASHLDGQRDEVYYHASCKDCGWSDWTQ